MNMQWGGVKNEHYETPVATVIEMMPETCFTTSTEVIGQDEEHGWYEVTI